MNYTEDKKKSKSFLIVLVGLLLLLNVVLGYKLWKGSQENQKQADEIVEIGDAKVELEGMLANVEKDLESLKVENTEMTAEMEAQRVKLEEQAAKIKTLLRRPNITRGQYAKLKSEMAALNDEVVALTAVRDSLAGANKILTDENYVVKENLEVKEREYRALSDEKDDIVKKGSKLKARGFQIAAVKYRNSGKEVETSRASRADAFKITYTIDENEIAQPGTKEVYIKIIDPELNTMVEKTSTSGVFNHNGKSSVFTLKKVMNYSNSAITETVVWKKGSDFDKGNYAIELYCEGNMIGGGKFTLR